MNEISNEVLQRVIGQYAEENANMRIIIERLSSENQHLTEELKHLDKDKQARKESDK